MTNTVSYVAAFGGGVASFVSPCVLPIVPGYLAVITGLDFADPEQGSRHHLFRIARDTILFVAGFTVVFVLLGITGATIGRAVFPRQGAAVADLGSTRDRHGGLPRRLARAEPPGTVPGGQIPSEPGPFRGFAAPVAGAAFGFGWQPCLGPILAAVTAVAATTGSAGQGAALLGVYSLGLGIPFLIVGLALGRVSGMMAFVRRHSRAITMVSVVVMGAFGVLLVTDKLTWVTSELETLMRDVGLGRLVRIG